MSMLPPNQYSFFLLSGHAHEPWPDDLICHVGHREPAASTMNDPSHRSNSSGRLVPGPDPAFQSQGPPCLGRRECRVGSCPSCNLARQIESLRAVGLISKAPGTGGQRTPITGRRQARDVAFAMCHDVFTMIVRNSFSASSSQSHRGRHVTSV
ncbi:hypothetical protein BCR34DRAFT_576731 [Clohesyomyces aquaticus]|uniref:Uncharacterized protein n=1 Tax=Clohesyomyces aquaticus TaxID=1231657 RepID=A0A1Y1YMK1_9PLEO|nr:hypothetical protein BCR34DRAFT_576731 [Clohesyomyces aquaticus]